MYCQHCGHKNNPESKFCEACGKPTAVFATTSPSGKMANINLKILALVALIAVVAVVIWILVSQMGVGLNPTPNADDIRFVLTQGQRIGELRDLTIIRKAECQLSPNRKASGGLRSEWVVEYSETSYSSVWVTPKRPDGLITETRHITVGLKEDGSWIDVGWMGRCSE